MNKMLAAILITTNLFVISCSENRHVPEDNRLSDVGVNEQDGKLLSYPEYISQRRGQQQQAQDSDQYMGAVLTKTEAGYAGVFIKPRAAELQAPLPDAHWNRDSYNALVENGFINTHFDPLSTFSIDVDTASYSNVRSFITSGTLPPVGAVRAEEMINYFSYDYPEPDSTHPVSLSAEAGPSPFNQEYRLVKIGVKAKDIKAPQRPPSNLVFLIDVSGSMNQPNKLPLLKKSMKLLVSQLGPHDKVSIVVYAGSDRIVLQPTPGSDHRTISDAIDDLHSGGSTHGSQGIITAYTLARQAFMPGGNNRIILASDGDFNVGITSRAELQRLVEKQRSTGVFLTLLGFGSGNFHDDTMEILADKGNGNYAYIDSLLEAKKVLVKEMAGTLYTLARDVKIQVEFNPAHVGAYRLIGYENRTLADEDFNDDRTDAGEIGAGHHVTALYELIPAGHPSIPQVDPLKYQRTGVPRAADKGELLTIKLRYKPKGSQVSHLISMTVSSEEKSLGETSDDFKFAAAVAGYAMLLSDSEHVGSFSWDECLQLILNSRGADLQGYRSEFYQIVERSQLLSVSS